MADSTPAGFYKVSKWGEVFFELKAKSICFLFLW